MSARKTRGLAMGRGVEINLKTTGPVSNAYFWTNALLAAIIGPVGSGKTYTSVQRAIYRATLMPRNPADGARYYRLAVFRQDYRTLWRTSVRSWQQILPPDKVGEWQGGQNQPATHVISFNDGKGPVIMQADFISIPQDTSIEDALRGFEATDGWINEIDTERKELVEALYGRLGRFPPASWGEKPPPQLWGDMNMPVVTNWAYQYFVKSDNPDVACYIQPGGMDPGAENLENLPGGREYYLRQMAVTTDTRQVSRMVHNRPGYPSNSKAIYGDLINSEFHVSKVKIAPHPRLALRLGVDGGRTPAVVILQFHPDGRVWVLGEIIGENVGVDAFSLQVMKDLQERYGGTRLMPPEGAWHDPSNDFASAQPGVTETGEEATWMEEFEKLTGIPSQSARGENRLVIRDQAIETRLTSNINGQPSVLIDPSCNNVIEGLAFGYQTARVTSENSASSRLKNNYSHPVEALQYGLLSDDAEITVLSERSNVRPPQDLIVEDEYDPLAF